MAPKKPTTAERLEHHWTVLKSMRATIDRLERTRGDTYGHFSRLRERVAQIETRSRVESRRIADVDHRTQGMSRPPDAKAFEKSQEEIVRQKLAYVPGLVNDAVERHLHTRRMRRREGWSDFGIGVIILVVCVLAFIGGIEVVKQAITLF